MDDLSSLDWSKPTGPQSKPAPGSMMMNPSSYPSLRPTPSPAGSARSTPTPSSQAPFSSSVSAKPAPDSFSNLVNFGGPAKPKQNLSLAERQAQLEAEKKRKQDERVKQTEAQFGSAQQWDALGSRKFTPSPSVPTPGSSNGLKNGNDDEDNDDDLFAAFNKDTKVDNASHYPPAAHGFPAAVGEEKLLHSGHLRDKLNGNDLAAAAADDDDPFGLNEMRPSGQISVSSAQADDDEDFLGDLGKPIEEVRMKQKQQQQRKPEPEPGRPIEDADSSSSEDDQPPARTSQRQREARRPDGSSREFDRAVAQLVDYGFSPEDAQRGLSQSGAGINVQAAANWLLDDAHRKAKEKAQGRSSSAGSGRRSDRAEHAAAGSSGRGGESDLGRSAATVGSSFFKTANSLWKSGQKKMQQAVADLQQDGGDPSQPRWMRDAPQGRSNEIWPSRRETTDEALALESGSRPGQSRPGSRPAVDPSSGLQQSRTSSPAERSSAASNQNRQSPVPRWQQQQRQSGPVAVSDARSRLSRLKADDDDSFSGYVSASRRKKAASPVPSEAPKQPQEDAEPDLLVNTNGRQPSQPIPQRPAQRQPPAFVKQSLATPPASRKSTPKPPRQVPPISPAALQSSNRHRLDGTAHFKRGDYASAHSSYTKSMSTVPATHPLLIVLLTNRALTGLKTGEPKQAINDADEALKIIGPGNGQGERVGVQGEGGKEEARDMKELYGKALSRKAEALEQLEKWLEAGNVWQQCVEGGVGGATAIKGRQRCQNATAPKIKAAPKAAAAAAAAARPASSGARSRTSPSATSALAPAKKSEAVTRLREANEAAAREDDEKFALSEKVDAKVSAWRDGKRDNLRGLIASLDQVLWENSGWKKVGMHELVMANKVKISYMKAIAKTHPDKLPQDASTEVRLIAGLVFATLNESWDKFKADNGL